MDKELVGTVQRGRLGAASDAPASASLKAANVSSQKSSCSSVYALGDAWVYSRPGIAGRLIVSHRIVKALINTIKFAY